MKCKYCDHEAVQTLIWLKDKTQRRARIKVPWCGCDLQVALKRFWAIPYVVIKGVDYDVEPLSKPTEAPVMTERCDYCQRRLDQPGIFNCMDARHPKPTLAQRIVNAIEHDLNDRRGLKINTLDYDTQDTIRDAWTTLIEDEIERAF